MSAEDREKDRDGREGETVQAGYGGCRAPSEPVPVDLDGPGDDVSGDFEDVARRHPAVRNDVIGNMQDFIGTESSAQQPAWSQPWVWNKMPGDLKAVAESDEDDAFMTPCWDTAREAAGEGAKLEEIFERLRQELTRRGHLR